MNKKKKGEYGYRICRKRFQLGIVLVAVLAILIQLGARNFTQKPEIKNILTVMAVLTVLPMANVASPLVASWRYKSLDRRFYEACHVFEDRFVLLYELVITSREQIIPVEAAAVHPSGIFLYCPSGRLNTEKAKTYLTESLKAERFKLPVHFLKDEQAFLKRLSSLKAVTDEDDEIEIKAAAHVLERLSM